MRPFKARAELYRSASAGFEEVLDLKLEPIMGEVRVAMLPGPPNSQVDYALELARQMIAATRGLITETIMGAVFKDKAKPNTDWEAFERTELEEVSKRYAELMKLSERQQALLLTYRGFMEANGKSWQALERLVTQ